jgi:NACalpha-BTF3-like transcription factor
MSLYVFHSDKAEQETPIFWCKVIAEAESHGAQVIVKATHTFEQQVPPQAFSSLALTLKGEFVCFSTHQEYEEFVKGKPSPSSEPPSAKPSQGEPTPPQLVPKELPPVQGEMKSTLDPLSIKPKPYSPPLFIDYDDTIMPKKYDDGDSIFMPLSSSKIKILKKMMEKLDKYENKKNIQTSFDIETNTFDIDIPSPKKNSIYKNENINMMGYDGPHDDEWESPKWELPKWELPKWELPKKKKYNKIEYFYDKPKSPNFDDDYYKAYDKNHIIEKIIHINKSYNEIEIEPYDEIEIEPYDVSGLDPDEINTVMNQANCTYKQAVKALKKYGNIVDAILFLTP